MRLWQLMRELPHNSGAYRACRRLLDRGANPLATVRVLVLSKSYVSTGNGWKRTVYSIQINAYGRNVNCDVWYGTQTHAALGGF